LKVGISVMSAMFPQALGRRSVKCVLLVMLVGLHLPLKIRILLGLIMCGFLSVLIYVGSKHVV
jgi:hypothetical protein